jgi:phenylpyruvate tautomerase PptA (4-oxalocrotonate tautomerase family)
MPMIEITMIEGALSPKAKQELMNELSDIVLKYEGFEENEMAKQFAFAWINELKKENFTKEGQIPEEAYYRLLITTPEGAIDEKDKPALVREVTQTVIKAEGSEYTSENRRRVFCILDTVAEGNWGGSGRILHLQALRERMLKSKDRE